MAFNAFISYSHAADGRLAPALQRGLQQLAKPWSKRQALRIFRDDTGLSVSPALWQSITTALDESDYFILLASPGAAGSEWVNQEIAYWMASRPDAAARVLPVLTAGEWRWDSAIGDIDWAVSTAAPAALVGVFASEPRHLDLVWAQSQDQLDLRNTRFRDAVADLAAPIHGVPKDELESEDVRQHRKALRLRRGSIAALALLAVGLGVAGLLALRAADTARGALRDLEDANGNIDDLTAEGEELAAANQQAEVDLTATEVERAEAEALAADAQRDAEVAAAAREQAETARASAEAAQAAAEAQQVEAEQARAAAELAQTAAEQGQDAAEAAAADAEEAEAEARLQEGRARADEQEATAARAAAEAASAAAGAAEAQARADERAAAAASDAARQQEAEARRAEAAAQAGERVARAAEAGAVAAEEAAVAAAAAARAAEATAVEAAAVAEQRRQEAQSAALSASLAQVATTQSDPALNALLAVESYCAVAACDAQADGLRAAPIVQRQLRQATAYDPDRLDPLVPMVDSVSRHQDLVRQLQGWSGHAIDVAVSGDGNSIVALRDDGTARIWHPAALDGAELSVGDAIGIAISDDGTTVAVVTARPMMVTSGGPRGTVEEIRLIDLSGANAGGGGGGLLIVDENRGTSQRADISFQPGSRDIVLINLGAGTTMLFDPTIQPSGGDDFPDYTIGSLPATWYGRDRIIFVGHGEAFVTTRRGAERRDIQNVPGSKFPTTVSSVDDTAVIGYSDGSVGVVRPDGRFSLEEPVDGTRIDDIAVSPDGRVVITSTQAGPVRRIGVDERNLFLAADVAVRSRRPISLATGRGPADVLIVAVDERVEVWTASASWAGSFVRPGVVAPPTSAGGLLAPVPGGHELGSPDGSVRLADVELPAVISADGSTLVMAGSRPRVGPVNAIGDAPSLDVPAEHSIAGPLASTATGTIVATVLDGPEFTRGVTTFDGRTGARLETIAIRPVFSGGSVYDVDIVDLLVSDEAIVLQRAERDPTSFLQNDRIEVHPHGSRAPSLIVNLRGRSPMSLTSGPDATLYIAHPEKGVITAYPVAGGAPVDVLDVDPNESVSAIGAEMTGGELMVVGYHSGLVELSNLDTGSFVTVLSRHGSPVTNAVIGQSTTVLRVSTTTATEGVTRTLDDPTLLRRVLCTMSGRDLSDAEWRRYVGAGNPQPCARGLS